MLAQMTAMSLVIVLGFYLGGGIVVSILCVLACGVEVDEAIKNNDSARVLRARAELLRNIRHTWTWPVDLARTILRGGQLLFQGIRVLITKP